MSAAAILDKLPRQQVERYGWVPDLPDPRDRSFNLEEPIHKASSLPTKFSLRGQMPSVFDQGQLGSCVPNGTVATLMAAGMKQGEAELMLSRLFVYFCGRTIEGTVREDSGLQVRDAIKVLATIGAPAETDWPYDIAKFKLKPPAKAFTDAVGHEALVYKRIDPRGPGAPLRSALFAGNAIVKGFVVPERFEDPSWDPAKTPLPLPAPGEGFLGGHCTVTTGWDFSLKRFKIPVFEERNSWGPDWGDGGYYYTDARWLWEPELSSDFWIIQKAS